jgi:hypothetical protein
LNPVAPLWFAYLVGCGWLFQRWTGWLTRFGIFTTLLIALFIRYGVAIPFSDNVNPQYTGISIRDHQLIEYYVAVALVYAGILAGVWMVDRAWDRISPRFVGTSAQTLWLAFVSIGLLVLIVFVWIILPWRDFVAGFQAIIPGSHSGADYRLHRGAYGTDTAYSNSIVNYVGSFARFALASTLVWVLYFHRRQSRLLAALFWAMFGVLGIIGVLSGQKMPALILGIGLVSAILIERGRPSVLSWKTIALVAIGLFFVLPALYLLQYPGQPYGSLLQIAVFRMSEEYSRVAQLRFIYYPDLHPFLHGLSSFIIRGAAHLAGFDVSSGHSPETYIPAHTAGAGPGYGGTWNAGFFADAWADFGFVGVLGASMVVGGVVRLIDRWYRDGGKGPIEMGLYSALCISAIYVSEVSTLTVLWTFGLASAFLVYLVLRMPELIDRVHARVG